MSTNQKVTPAEREAAMNKNFDEEMMKRFGIRRPEPPSTYKDPIIDDIQPNSGGLLSFGHEAQEVFRVTARNTGPDGWSAFSAALAGRFKAAEKGLGLSLLGLGGSMTNAAEAIKELMDLKLSDIKEAVGTLSPPKHFAGITPGSGYWGATISAAPVEATPPTPPKRTVRIVLEGQGPSGSAKNGKE